MRKITLVVEYKGRCVRKLNAQIRRNKIFDWGHGSGEKFSMKLTGVADAHCPA